MNDVIAYGGIGNRVNELVNGLAAYGNSGMDVKWHIDRHMPFKSCQIFHAQKLGVNSVLFQDIPVGHKEYKTEFVDYWGLIDKGMPYCSYWYPAYSPMGVELTREKLIYLYGVVTSSLKAYNDGVFYPMAAHYRGMGDAGMEDVESFVAKVKEEWDKLNILPSKLFLLADTQRESIQIKLDKLGIPYQTSLCNQMSNDMDRESLAQMRLFMSDYLTLNDCPVIVTSSSISTMTDPARAKGARIVHLGRKRDDGNCFFVKHMPKSFIQ